MVFSMNIGICQGRGQNIAASSLDAECHSLTHECKGESKIGTIGNRDSSMPYNGDCWT